MTFSPVFGCNFFCDLLYLDKLIYYIKYPARIAFGSRDGRLFSDFFRE